MRKILLALALLCFSVPSFAADKPLVIESGKIKQLPASTTLQINASGTGAASINIPHGSAPTSPNNGDCWTTSAGLFCRINGANVSYGSAGTGSITASGYTMSSGTLLGRSSASTGAIEELSVGSGLTLSGGTLSASGGGGGATYTKVTVATAGDTFIGVPLDSDNGYMYEVVIKGAPSANATLAFQISNDNGTTWKAGASDYKSYFGGTTASSVQISGAQGAGRYHIVRFTLGGMNVVATDEFNFAGNHITVGGAGTLSSGTVGGGQSSLGGDNWNAFKIFASAGNMNGYAVYWRKVY